MNRELSFGETAFAFIFFKIFSKSCFCMGESHSHIDVKETSARNNLVQAKVRVHLRLRVVWT